jgi:hypothetical protein
MSRGGVVRGAAGESSGQEDEEANFEQLDK